MTICQLEHYLTAKIQKVIFKRYNKKFIYFCAVNNLQYVKNKFYE